MTELKKGKKRGTRKRRMKVTEEWEGKGRRGRGDHTKGKDKSEKGIGGRGTV